MHGIYRVDIYYQAGAGWYVNVCRFGLPDDPRGPFSGYLLAVHHARLLIVDTPPRH